MTRRATAPAAAVGQWVLITHHLAGVTWWRCSEVLWSRGDWILVIDESGTMPRGEPVLLSVEAAVSLIGTEAECRAALDAARRAEEPLDVALRGATVRLADIEERRRDAALSAAADRVAHMRGAKA